MSEGSFVRGRPSRDHRTAAGAAASEEAARAVAKYTGEPMPAEPKEPPATNGESLVDSTVLAEELLYWRRDHLDAQQLSEESLSDLMMRLRRRPNRPEARRANVEITSYRAEVMCPTCRQVNVLRGGSTMIPPEGENPCTGCGRLLRPIVMAGCEVGQSRRE